MQKVIQILVPPSRGVPNPAKPSSTACWTIFKAAWIAALLLSTAIPAAAQVSSGTISGRATDPSGAVVVGAGLALENTATGAKLTGKTNEVGDYAFRNLQPGKYNLTVTHPGFRTLQKNDIPVRVSETTAGDVTLTVGEPTTSVTVESELAALDTSSSTLGTVVSERQVRDLPLNGRNFTQLLTLTTGVASVGTTGSWGVPQTGTFVMPSINGQSAKSSMWLLDGANNSSPAFSLISIAPVVDDISEFKLVSHADSAEYGGVLGGVVNVVTKGGTNELHGGIWEFLRNDALDARNTFRQDITPLKQNQFGGNIGGPFVLPKIYKGRNRTFFFGSYQGFRQNVSSKSLYRVPTAAELNGDLRGEQPIFDPYSTRPDPANPGQYLRDPFAGNQIPVARMSPTALNYFKKLFPAPVETGVPGRNGFDPRPQITNQDLLTLRGDHQTRSDFISFRYNRLRTPVAQTGGLVGSTFSRNGKGYTVAANYTRTISPSMVFHTTFSRSWIALDLTSKWDNVDYETFPLSLGIDENFVCGHQGGGFGSKKCFVPLMGIDGFPNVNNFNSQVGQTDIWEFRPDLSLIRGNHSFKMGFGLATHNLWAWTQRAFEFFGPYQTADLKNPGGTGTALASFLLGVPRGSERADAPNGMRPAWIYGGFFQDQWKVTPRLTLNLGLRWDANILPQFGQESNDTEFSGSMDTLRGVFLIPKDPGACAKRGKAPCIPTPDGSLPPHVQLAPGGRIYRNVYDNWQPRIGLAFKLTNRTVLRAGAGRYFDSWNETSLAAAQSEGLWPDQRRIVEDPMNLVNVDRPITRPLNLGSLYPDPTPFNLAATWRDPQMKNPMSDQYNVGVEHQVSSTSVLKVNYVGSRGRRIPIGGDWNTAVTPGPGDPSLRKPYPYIIASPLIRDWGKNWYDSLQASLDKRFSNGFSYAVAYTWSKAMDVTASDGFSGGAQNPYNIWADKSVTSLNLPHILNLSWVYELPFGRGRKYRTGNTALDFVVGEWQFNGIAQFTSGSPYGLVICGDIANIGRGGCYTRPNLVGDPNLSNPSPAAWFNKAAFAPPAVYNFGNLGRNPLKGDGYKNFDLSLFRDFTIKESWKVQFRAEAFNATNTVTYGNPVGNLGDRNVGRVFGTRSTERQVQLGLKMYF